MTEKLRYRDADRAGFTKIIAAAMVLAAAVSAFQSARADHENHAANIRLAEETVRGGSLEQVEDFVASIAESDLPQAAKIQIIAVAYTEQYIKNGTDFRKKRDTRDREFGLDAKVSDCSAMAVSILRSAGVDIFEPGYDYLGRGRGDGMQGVIRKIAGTDSLKAPYRRTDPKIGDIMMWAGHVGIVTRVTNRVVFWANMGPEYNAAHKHALLDENGAMRHHPYWTSENMDFWGFYTIPETEAEPKPADNAAAQENENENSDAAALFGTLCKYCVTITQ